MSKLPVVLSHLPFPVIGSPLFIISNPKLVIAQCIAGVVGSMPALNARPAEQLPAGVRLMLQLDGKALTRDIAIAPGA